MAIVVETGTGLDPTANSYSSLADIREYAAARGVTLDADDNVLSPLAFVAMDYIEALRARFKGRRAIAGQPLQWPRAGVVIDGSLLQDGQMPPELAKAQAQLCIEQFNGVSISPTQTKFAVQRTKVDVIGVAYATGGSSQPATMDPTPVMPVVDGYLDPLLMSGGRLNTVRV